MKRSLLIWVAGAVVTCLPTMRHACSCDRQRDEATTPVVCLTWTEEQREAAPEQFFLAVCKRLEQEIADLKPACDGMSGDIKRQNQAIEEKMELWRNAKDLAETFRDAYRRAKKQGQWPVEVCGGIYCEEQLASQVNMLLEEAKSFAHCVAKLKNTRERAEAKLEELTVRTQQVDTQLSICATKYELWKASRLQFHGQQLLAYCEELIEDNGRLHIPCRNATEDGFPCIPVATVRSHRNGDRLVNYLESEIARNKKQPQQQFSRVDKQVRKKCIFAQN